MTFSFGSAEAPLIGAALLTMAVVDAIASVE